VRAPPSILAPAKGLLAAALPALGGSAGVGHARLAAACLVVAARGARAPIFPADAAAAAGADVNSLLRLVGTLSRELGVWAPRVRAAAFVPRAAPSAGLPPASLAAVRATALTIVAWWETGAGGHAPALDGAAALAGAALALAAAAEGAPVDRAQLAAACRVTPQRLGRGEGALRAALAAAARALPWLGAVSPKAVHAHLPALLAASAAAHADAGRVAHAADAGEVALWAAEGGARGGAAALPSESLDAAALAADPAISDADWSEYVRTGEEVELLARLQALAEGGPPAARAARTPTPAPAPKAARGARSPDTPAVEAPKRRR